MTEVPATPRLRFGLQPPANALRAWGARAIYRMTPEPYIDLLYDRQDWYGATQGEEGTQTVQFQEWVNTVGLPWLRRYVKRTWLSNSEHRRVAHVEGQRVIAANPNASYGYLYIVAYELPEGATPDEVDTPTPPDPPAQPARTAIRSGLSAWPCRRRSPT